MKNSLIAIVAFGFLGACNSIGDHENQVWDCQLTIMCDGVAVVSPEERLCDTRVNIEDFDYSRISLDGCQSASMDCDALDEPCDP